MTPSQERWAARDSRGPKGSHTALGDARSTPHTSGEVRKSFGLVRSTWHHILWPCSQHPSASQRGGREILTTKPRWPVSGALRQHCPSPALELWCLGTAQWGSLKGSMMLGQKGLLTSKSLNKTTAHPAKWELQVQGGSKCQGTPTRTQCACSPLQKKSHITSGKNIVTVLFPCLKTRPNPKTTIFSI